MNVAPNEYFAHRAAKKSDPQVAKPVDVSEYFRTALEVGTVPTDRPILKKTFFSLTYIAIGVRNRSHWHAAGL